MKATLNGTVIAEAPQEDLISIEGNWYFPPASITAGRLTKTATPYTCPWKGAAQYFAVTDGEASLPDRAWSYPTPYATAFDRVGQDFSGYVAFWKEVKVA